MNTADAVLSVLLFLGLLMMNVIFYGFSAAIQNLNVSEVEEHFERMHDRKSKCILKVSQNIAKYVNTVQVVATLVQLIMGGFFLRIGTGFVRSGLRKLLTGQEGATVQQVMQAASVFLAFMLLIFILLLAGVLIPKKVAAIYPQKWAYACVPVTYMLCCLLTPLTALIDRSANGLLRVFGIRQPKDESEVTEAEIISMVNEGHEQGVLEESEAEMITNIFEFGDKTVRDIMTNRQNINMLDAQMRLSDAIAYMLEGTNSRYPVYSETPDQIIGFLHLKDACRYQHKLRMEDQGNQKKEQEREGGSGKDHNDPRLKSCRSILRKPEFVPETMNIDDLFHSMQSKRLQMVIVADEYGQTVGLVAMEDILEEIVGNIQDEYDEEQRFIIRTGPDRFVADGMTPLEDLETLLNISFDEDIEVDTLNGFMILQMEHVPEEKESFSMQYQGYEFRIRRVERRVIRSVLIIRLQEASDGSRAGENEKKVEQAAE